MDLACDRCHGSGPEELFVITDDHIPRCLHCHLVATGEYEEPTPTCDRCWALGAVVPRSPLGSLDLVLSVTEDDARDEGPYLLATYWGETLCPRCLRRTEAKFTESGLWPMPPDQKCSHCGKPGGRMTPMDRCAWVHDACWSDFLEEQQRIARSGHASNEGSGSTPEGEPMKGEKWLPT